MSRKAFFCVFSATCVSAQPAISLESPVDYLKLDLAALSDIVVTSVSKKSEKASAAAAAIYVITSDDIKRSGATSIPEALRVVPGLQVARINANQWAISARGFNGQYANKLLVLMDGRTVYTPQFSGVYWDAQDTVLEDIERIEVIRGPGATLWGANAVNGVINIITKSAKETQDGVATVVHGNDETIGSARYGGQQGNLFFRTYAKVTERDAFHDLGGNNAQDDWKNRRAGFRADWEDDRFGDSFTLQGDVYSGENGWNFRLPQITTPFINSYADAMEVGGGNLLGRWTKQLEGNDSVSVQVYFDTLRRDISILNQTEQTFDIDFQHIWNASHNQEIVWGLGVRNRREEVQNSTYISYASQQRTDNLVSAFIQDKFPIVSDSLYATLGTKIEHFDSVKFEIQPSARLTWLVDENQTAWASVARAVRTPSRNEDDLSLILQAIPNLTYVRTTPNPIGQESEELLAYELGYRISPSDRLNFDLAFFYNEYDQLRTFEPNGTPVVPLGNLGYGETYGAEVTASWDVSDNWSLRGSYSYLDMNLHTNPGSTDTSNAGDEGEAPQHQFNLQSHLAIRDNINLSNYLYYVDNLRSANVDSYIRLDAVLSWKPSDDLEVSLVGQNLLDDWHQEFSESLYQSPTEIGRSVYGKVTLHF